MPAEVRQVSNQGLLFLVMIRNAATRSIGRSRWRVCLINSRRNRLDFVFRALKEWTEVFFDANPLASLLILGMRDGLAERYLIRLIPGGLVGTAIR
jgi:hypothetical protein